MLKPYFFVWTSIWLWLLIANLFIKHFYLSYWDSSALVNSIGVTCWGFLKQIIFLWLSSQSLNYYYYYFFIAKVYYYLIIELQKKLYIVLQFNMYCNGYCLRLPAHIFCRSRPITKWIFLLTDTVMLEFRQYAPGSRWRHTAINRRNHREEGNEADGFYGGIRKLKSEREISMWTSLWPTEVLE